MVVRQALVCALLVCHSARRRARGARRAARAPSRGRTSHGLCLPVHDAFLVVPEDVGTAFAAIYGFTPRIVIGRDHRFGFGFRFGNHADFQLLYELGPQSTTAALRSSARVRSALHEHRGRRRPFVELLLRAGWLATPGFRGHPGDCDDDDEPR